MWSGATRKGITSYRVSAQKKNQPPILGIRRLV